MHTPKKRSGAAPEEVSAKKQAVAAGRAEARKLSKAEEQVDQGFGHLDTLVVSEEEKYLVRSLKDKPALRSRLCSLLNLGLLEKIINKGEGKQDAAASRDVLFKTSGCKWRDLSEANARRMLGWMVPETIEWSMDKDWLKSLGDVGGAAKLVRFALGVLGKNNIPTGVVNPHHAENLQPLTLQRYQECGKRLAKFKKQDFGQEINYWIKAYSLEIENIGVSCAMYPDHIVEWPVQADDWDLEQPQDFKQAQITSSSSGMEMKIWKLFAKKFPAAVVAHDEDFNYPAGFNAAAAMAGAGANVPARANASMLASMSARPSVLASQALASEASPE